VYVLVLLEAAGRGERLATLGARVRAGADVRRTNVTLQVARVTEHLVTRLTRERLEGEEELVLMRSVQLLLLVSGGEATATSTTAPTTATAPTSYTAALL